MQRQYSQPAFQGNARDQKLNHGAKAKANDLLHHP